MSSWLSHAAAGVNHATRGKLTVLVKQLENQGKAPKALALHVANVIWGAEVDQRFASFPSSPYRMELGGGLCPGARARIQAATLPFTGRVALAYRMSQGTVDTQ